MVLTKNAFILGDCFLNMTNRAVREGTINVPMISTIDLCSATFSVVSTSDELSRQQITGSGCTVDATLTNLYYINQSGLIIRNSTTTENGQPISTAGLYMADCNGNKRGAKLLVISE